MTTPKKGTQAWRILEALMRNRGEWVNGRYFLHELYLSQYHARIKDLEDIFGWKIEHSDFTDEYGFKSYRIYLKEPDPVVPYGQGDEEDVEITGVEGAIRKSLRP